MSFYKIFDRHYVKLDAENEIMFKECSRVPQHISLHLTVYEI